MNYDIVGIGNALVDIQVQIDENRLKDFSLPKGGMTLAELEQQQSALKKLSSLVHEISSGGSAANTIHGMQHLGAKTYYIGRVSNDFYGRHYLQDMQNCGVGFSISSEKQDKTDTGTCLIFITPDAQRTMLTHLGVSAFLSPSDIQENIIEQAKYIYIEGYLFTQEPTRSAALLAAQIAKEHNIPIAFTLSDTFVVNTFYTDIKNFVSQYADIVFCNEEEGFALTKANDTKKAFSILKEMVDIVFLTRAEQGVWASCKSSKEEVNVEAFSVTAVDTTGAGDLFATGALWGILQKKNLYDCSILGNYCASQTVAHMGARLSVNTETDIEKILELNK